MSSGLYKTETVFNEERQIEFTAFDFLLLGINHRTIALVVFIGRIGQQQIDQIIRQFRQEIVIVPKEKPVFIDSGI